MNCGFINNMSDLTPEMSKMQKHLLKFELVWKAVKACYSKSC